MAGRGCRAPTLCPLLVSPLGVSSTQPGVSLGWGGISCGWHHHHHQPLSVRDTVKVITPRTGTAARVAGRAGRWAERGQGQSGSTDEGQTLTGPIAASCSTSNTNKHASSDTSAIAAGHCHKNRISNVVRGPNKASFPNFKYVCYHKFPRFSAKLLLTDVSL